MATEVCEACGTRCAVGVPHCPQCSSTRLVPEETLAGLMPSLTVACVNDQCPAKGVERRVGLPQVVPGLLALPRLVCAKCGFEPIRVTEDIVPKITVHGGASNAAADAEAAEAEAVQDEGGEQPSPVDTTSSTSSEKESSSPGPSEKQGPSRARTTGSRSKTGQTGTSSARSTGGGRETGTSETGSADK
ncbi:hypothetical protein [Streptomyces sp. NPDC001139]